jgi:hypothetical protein
MLHRSGSSSRTPNGRSLSHARPRTIHHRAHLGAVTCKVLFERKVDHPLGCHKPRTPDRVVFGKLVEVLVFGRAYERIADESRSENTLRRMRDEWIDFGLMESLR